MKTIDHSIYIRRPAAEVFNFVCDSANTSLWQPEARTSQHTPPGPLRAGTQIENTASNVGIALKSTSTVTEFRPGEKVAFDLRTAGGRINARLVWAAQPESAGTRFQVRAHYQLKGLLNLTTPLFSPIARKTIARHLTNLKALLEAGF